MNRYQFSGLVRRLDDFAAEYPAAYKRRVMLLASLGYVYIFSILAALVAITWVLVKLAIGARSFAGVLVVKNIGLPLAVLELLILRSLWVRFDPPEGLPITRRDAPVLFGVLDKLRARLRGPKIHTVLVTDDFNAAIMQIPRLGILGWQKNYLIIGLPLMQGLSADQVIAVLAHEYGHLAGAHGRFSSWIYRVRQTWYQILQTLMRANHWGVAIFYYFFRWYAPYFAAYSFTLARADEYEADRGAARAVGARQAADALANASVRGHFLHERFWPTIYKQARVQPQPPQSIYSQLPIALRAGLTAADAEKWLQQAMAKRTDIDDTHPSLRDRLAALKQSPRLTDPGQDTAAARLLGPYAAKLVRRMDEAWLFDIREQWQERHAAYQAEKKELMDLDRQASQFTLGHDQTLRRAALTEDQRGPADAAPIYQEFLKRYPEHAPANFALGRVLLATGEAAGIEWMEKAMSLEDDCTGDACELIYDFYRAHGQDAEAAKIFRRARKWMERAERQQEEDPDAD